MERKVAIASAAIAGAGVVALGAVALLERQTRPTPAAQTTTVAVIKPTQSQATKHVSPVRPPAVTPTVPPKVATSKATEEAKRDNTKIAPVAPVKRVVQSNATLPPDVLKMHPNEAGRIPILMYHSIGDNTVYRGARYDRLGLNISVETFRKHLNLMYAAGWYPVNMRDVMSPHLDVPAGKTPVVLTFDDARASQFRYKPDGTIDPNCAVGLIEAFHERHPDWPTKATFFVLPKSHYNPVPFQQEGREAKKLRYLFDQGYEIANHSTTHHSMSNMGMDTVQKEVTGCIKYIRAREPRATMDTFCLPYGNAPRNRTVLAHILTDGSKNSAYHNKCVLLAGGNASVAPWDKRVDLLRVQRVASEPNLIEWTIKKMKRGGDPAWRPYVSDGDPNTITVPQSFARYIVPARLYGVPLVSYNDPSPKSPVRKTQVAQAKTSVKHGG